MPHTWRVLESVYVVSFPATGESIEARVGVNQDQAQGARDEMGAGVSPWAGLDVSANRDVGRHSFASMRNCGPRIPRCYLPPSSGASVTPMSLAKKPHQTYHDRNYRTRPQKDNPIQ